MSGPLRFVTNLRFKLSGLVYLGLSVVACVPAVAQVQPGGAFQTHQYRDLFVEDGLAPAEVNAKVEAGYAQFFHGDPETQSVLFKAGKNGSGPLAYVTDWANHDVRSEGMSYGMMLAVQLDHKDDFDALWNWAKTYMYVGDPKAPGYEFFAWSCKLDGTRNEQTPAPDGEEYFVTALYFASGRWGNGQGIYDYHAQADHLLTAMRHREEIDGETPQGFRHVSAETDEAHHMIRFTPSDEGRNFTDPSYHLPAFYELWARWGPVADRTFWAEAARASRDFFAHAANPRTGLAPVYANFDGTPHKSNFGQSTIFGFDAWRTASNWSADWNWFQADPREQALSDRIQAFFSSQGPQYPSIYTLGGKPLGPNDPIPSAEESSRDAVVAVAADKAPTTAKAPAAQSGEKFDHSPDFDHAAGLVAANAVVSLAATDRVRARRFTEALWDLPVPAGQFRYYNGMLYMISLLHTSGQFRIYPPQ